MHNQSMGYRESNDKLAVRINAHKKYSNFSLEDWLLNNMPLAKGNVLLDIGCGSGNMFPTYEQRMGSEGVIVGIDQSEDLLKEAKGKLSLTPSILLSWDMNKELPFIVESFDYIISTFAIYYAEAVSTILSEIYRVLKSSGEIFLIGPSKANAKELYLYNKRIFNIDASDKALSRSARLENEFYQIANDTFGETGIRKINSQLIFPDKKEFIRYYKSTLLFEESIGQTGFKPTDEDLYAASLPELEISKEMIILWAKK